MKWKPCLDRDHRMAYILGEVFELTSPQGAAILGITPAAFRKRLSRARIRSFMQAIKDSPSNNRRRDEYPSQAGKRQEPRGWGDAFFAPALLSCQTRCI